jgi:hypothetical protein
MKFDFTQKLTKKKKSKLAKLILEIAEQTPYSWSTRGWCYMLEGKGWLTKDQFDKVQSAINDLRKNGEIPVDLIAHETGRDIDGIFYRVDNSPIYCLRKTLKNVLHAENYYRANYWDDEKHFILIMVEKVDLITIFREVAQNYYLPLTNAKGWSSVTQRAEIGRLFKEAEKNGKKTHLLYFGDHDPDGLRIAETLKNNFRDIQNIVWQNGETGYDPKNLKIHRVGLKASQIKKLKLKWIDNLTTGRKDKNDQPRDLSFPNHKNHYLPYVQNYLNVHGAKKCEANAIVTVYKEAQKILEKEILRIMGDDVLERFRAKDIPGENEIKNFRIEKDIDNDINEMIDLVDEYEENYNRE